MRNLHRLFFIWMAVALAAASVPFSCVAQEAARPDEPGVVPVSQVADATGMNRYAQIDEDTLSQQRGRAPGFVMVAAAPQMPGNPASVTLWDELAPPTPLPVPVDAQRTMQGNTVTYTRQ
jgi:hypothetical protein